MREPIVARLVRGAEAWAVCVLLAAVPAWPCSVELLSIERIAARAPTIVTGRVLDVRGWQHVVDPEDPGRVVLEEVLFQVDHVLKGAAPDTVVLAYAHADSQDALLRLSCLGYPYRIGDHRLLMLGDPRADGTYVPPAMRPSLIRLADDASPAGSALVEYVRYIGEHGVRPIEIDFVAPEATPAGAPLTVTFTVTNHMPVTLTMAGPAGSYRVPEGNGAVLPLALGATDPRPDHPDTALAVVVPPGQRRSLDVPVHEYYDLGPGRHGFPGNPALGTVAGETVGPGGTANKYHDHWANFGNEFHFDIVAAETSVAPVSWATVKRGQIESGK